MTQEKLHLAVVLGSVREGRICETVANWAIGAIEADGRFSSEVIDPRMLDLPTWRGDRKSPQALALRQRLERADAFLVVTPEYNHGYSAALKAVIDLCGREWRARPVAFVSYGGISGGVRAVEQLRLVFAELHAVALRDSVSLPAVWNRFDEAGALADPERPLRAMGTLLARLTWWGKALRTARRDAPYDETTA